MAITGNFWPGVHLQLTDSRTSRVDLLRTDVAAFPGYASRGPLHTPIPIRSLRQLHAIFGEEPFPGYLADTVRAFFDNGGVCCWIIRIDSDSARPASADVIPTGSPARKLLTIEASSPGAWGNRLSVRLVRTRGVQVQVSQDSDLPPGCSRLSSLVGFPVGTQVVLRQRGKTFLNSVVQVDSGRRWVRWESSNSADLPRADFEPALAESLQFSLRVFLDGRFQGATEDLSLHEAHPRFIAAVFANPWRAYSSRQHLNTGMVPPLVCIKQHRKLELADLRMSSVTLPLKDGADGLRDVELEDFSGSTADDSVDSEDRLPRGIEGLATLREISLVAMPDLHYRPEIENPTIVPLVAPPQSDVCCCQPTNPPEQPPAVSTKRPPVRVFTNQEIAIAQQRLLDHCQRSGRRFAVLDPPLDIGLATSGGLQDVLDWRSQFDTSFGALYFPWIRISDPIRGGSRLVPPSGFVAGLAARLDLSVGVHRSPANVELVGAVDVAKEFSDAQHAMLNPAGINLIRPCQGRGIRVLGARTLTGEAPYQFVTVRRLMMMLRSALELSTQWAVFEPANDLTRARLKLSVESFLNEIWRRGMLAGSVPAQAYRVTCDDSNNPQQLVDNGMLLMNVEVAPAIPGEFILLRLGRIDGEQPAAWE